MAAYNEDQISQYLDRINYPRSAHPADALERLQGLVAHHLAAVPFESISLHYSKTRRLSIELDALFDKIVVRRHGGYCMELNTFFGAILRGLGYTVMNAGGRVKIGDRWDGWDHMLNLVTIDGQRYFVDVGFGADTATQPQPLRDGHVFDLVAPQRGRFEHRRLAQHTDPSQRVWIYLTEHKTAPSNDPSAVDDKASPTESEPSSSPSSSWVERVCFTEVEFFPNDIALMNLVVMTMPESFFVRTVIAARMELDERGRADSVVSLLGGEVRRRRGDQKVLLETLLTEEQRVAALERYFGVVLAEEEKVAIRGHATELKGPG